MRLHRIRAKRRKDAALAHPVRRPEARGQRLGRRDVEVVLRLQEQDGTADRIRVREEKRPLLVWTAGDDWLKSIPRTPSRTRSSA